MCNGDTRSDRYLRERTEGVSVLIGGPKTGPIVRTDHKEGETLRGPSGGDPTWAVSRRGSKGRDPSVHKRRR